MGLLDNVFDHFAHEGQGKDPNQGYPQQQYGERQQQYGGSGGYPQQPYNQTYNSERPNPPEPWIAEWDNQANQWIFINRQTGQRTHEFPNSNGYPPRPQGYESNPYPPQPQGYQQGPYPLQPQGYNNYGPPAGPHPQQEKSHAARNTALGVVAGVAGGALLMHEGHKIEEKWDEDKYRAEERFDDDRYRVEDRYEDDRYRVEDQFEQDRYQVEQGVVDFPDDAARWTGEKVQEVEDIPDDVERKWDNAVQDVEDVPEDIAGWAGDKVGDVERFGDNIEDAYDDGRDDARYDDDVRDNDW